MPLSVPTPSQPAFARSSRDLVRVGGPDAVGFLQGQLSQDVTGLAVGAVAWSFVLQPQGKVDARFRLRRAAEDAVELDVDQGWGAAIVARLNRFKMRTDCEIVLEPSAPIVAVRGLAVDGGLPCGWPGVEGTDHLGPELPPGLPAGAAEMEAESYEALRIICGVPAMGSELTESTIPAEAGQWVVDTSVSFTKGCFTGQELVARIDSRGGNVPRNLRGFTTESAPPSPGAEISLEGATIGTVTSAASSSDGTTVGLAYVKRSVDLPATGIVDGAVVEVCALPLL